MSGAVRAGVLLLAVALGACASTPRGSDSMGPTGLEGALPGGDGRSLLAYRSEYQGNVLQAMDSLMERLHGAWGGTSPDSVAELYGRNASVLAPGGSLFLDVEGVRGWAEATLPVGSSLNLWRELFTASGEMAVAYGRYEAESSGTSGHHRGFHLTVTKREGRDWKVRSQLFLSFEGAPPRLDSAHVVEEGVHITPERVRERRRPGRRGPGSALAEYTVNAYYRANSILGWWRHEWNDRAVERAVDMLAPDAVIRLPWDVPAVGRPAAAAALGRFIPAVGPLHMTILDFDASERVSYCLGRYAIEVPNDVLTGSFVVVIREEDRGPQIRALLFSGGGASSTEQ